MLSTWLVIDTSRTVGSANKSVRITSGFGGGEFTKTLRKVCTQEADLEGGVRPLPLKFAKHMLYNVN